MSTATAPKKSLLGSLLLFVMGLAAGAGGLIVALSMGVKLPLPEPAKDAAPGAEAEKPKGPVTADAKAKEIELRSMTSELARERERLDKQKEELDLKAKQVAIDKQTVETLKKLIDDAEKRIAEKVKEDQPDEPSEQKNAKRLGKMWAQMEPVQVLEIIAGLSDETIAQVLYTMSERQSAPILAAMGSAVPEGPRRASIIQLKLKAMRDPATAKLSKQPENKTAQAQPAPAAQPDRSTP
ncbi:MAG: hypothetical protein KIS92_07375 [Planctomycetota bacterium]|nr:hypothetical protein [Planctomycetota bacterium]